MKDTRWLEGIHQLDTLVPEALDQNEVIYTLYLKDFLGMPAVNFAEASRVDDNLRALFN